MPKNRDLELLYEIGSLRFIIRAWEQFLGPGFANLSDHHYRVAWTAIILANMEGKQVNTGKIVKMALVHDLAESRTGDVHYISRQYTKRDEHKAIRDILKNTSLEKEFVSLWQEYEERKTLEAKIVKDADWLDVDLEIKEQTALGRVHAKHWNKDRKEKLFKWLNTKSGKKLWKLIQKSDPLTWMAKSRSRYNSK